MHKQIGSTELEQRAASANILKSKNSEQFVCLNQLNMFYGVNSNIMKSIELLKYIEKYTDPGRMLSYFRSIVGNA